MLQDKRPSPGSACQHPDWSISTQTVLPQLFSSNNRVFLFPKEFSQQSYHNSSSSHCQIHFLKATKNEEERLWRNVSAQKRSFHCRAWRGDQAVVGIKETLILWEEPCAPWQEHLPCHPPGSVIHCSNGTSQELCSRKGRKKWNLATRAEDIHGMQPSGAHINAGTSLHCLLQ